MDLTIRHRTTYQYRQPTSRISLLLRLFPVSFDGQDVVAWRVTINGEEITAFSPNSRGDIEAHFQTAAPISLLEIEAFGAVITSDRSGVVKGVTPDVPPTVFLRNTALTVADEAIRTLAAQVGEGDPIARLHKLSALVSEAVIYRAGATNAETTAAQALTLGRGVCQDHAHVFVSAARVLGIPARYVVGYYLAGHEQDAVHETHGWAEAYLDGLGWVGFDITNGVCTTEHYVRLCCGLDAHDAAPIRGAVLGSEQIAIDADVMISEAESAGREQVLPQQQQ
jgi:transglutaminase-like putative cysteine protease